MDVIILHSPLDGASRQLMEALGGEPAGPDVTINVDGCAVRVISDHALAVAACPNFSAYPALVVRDGETVRVKSPVASWAECVAFIQAPAETSTPLAASVHVTKLEFASRFTADERQRILDAAGKRDADGKLVHPDVADAVNMVQMTPESAGINLRSPLLAGYAALLVENQLLTGERAAQILTP
jgi:hypothetical protein